MKSERRHELQHNVLADWLGQQIEWVGRYSQAIIASIVGMVVLSAVLFYWTAYRARLETNAWARYIASLELVTQGRGALNPLLDLAEQSPKTRGGQWARLASADLQFEQGVQQMFENRAQSNLSLTSALDGYSKLRGVASDPMLLARATFGLARCYEALNKLNDARLNYDLLLTRYPESVFAEEARQRRADLDKSGTKAFYDWFAQQDIKPTPPDEMGIRGHKPNFDLRSLPHEGPIFERPSMDKPSSSKAPADGDSVSITTLDLKGAATTDEKKPVANTITTESKPLEDKTSGGKAVNDKAANDQAPDDKTPSEKAPTEQPK